MGQSSATVFTNTNETGMHPDYERWLKKHAFHVPIHHHQHNLAGEKNGGTILKEPSALKLTVG